VATGAMTPRVGTAGRRGPDVRSDLHVEVDPAHGPGLDIRVESRVASLYGAQIRETVEETLHRLGVGAGRVSVEDSGALPWVIAARVEAAVLAAGLATRPAALTPAAAGRGPPPAASARHRLRRSRLYVPGNEPRFFLNAGLHDPDGIILDLEDSVHPDAKAAARVLVRHALRHVEFRGAERMVRINQLPLGLEDLDEVLPEAPDVILVPKVERPEQVVEVAERARSLRAAGAAPDRPVWLMPILESALGVEHAFAVATAHPDIIALTVGLEDYTADLGVARTREGHETAWARQRLVNAARAAGIQPIDSVFADIGDDDGLFAWGVASRALGFVGMGCVHPRQVRIIHQAFAPSPEEIEKALRIVDAFRDAQSRGLAAVSLGNKMIDPPVVLRARRLVERAAAMGLLEGGDP
jgi:citrate lyase subunit beta / citryl-CoA lyase